MNGHTGATLLNLVNMLSSKQNLLIPALELNTTLVDEEFANAMNAVKINSLKDFKAAYQLAGPELCKGITFDFDTGLFALHIKGDDLNDDKTHAFADLAVFINKNAKVLKKTSPKPAQVDNPKYALRTWLIRLGMNGEAFKRSRKVLLENLEGSSAFRIVEKKEVNNG